MKSLGICAGASSISIAGLEQNGSGTTILFSRSQAPDSNPRRTLRELLGQIDDLHDFKMAGLNRSQAALRNSTIFLLTSMASRNKFGII